MTGFGLNAPTRARRSYRLPTGIAAVAAAIIALAVVVGLTAGWIAPYDYTALNLRARLVPPVWLDGGSWNHPLGTDHLGRDILSRLLVSVQVSLGLALVGTVLGALIGTFLGFLAAHFRGIVDDLVMAAVDLQAAMPVLVLALVFLALFPGNLLTLLLLLGIHGWDRYARIARGLVRSAQGQGYVTALRSIGAGPWRIHALHVLPNILSALVVNMTLNFPEVVLLETSLSFLGLGIQPPLTSLGNMAGLGRDFLLSAWWIAAVPATAIFLVSLSFGLLGDWLRDRLDPSLRGA